MRAGRSIALAALAACATSTGAAAATYAPLNRPGPKLGVPKAKLAASLRCGDDVARAVREPVLLVPATEVDSHENFAWNYARALRAAGIPFCTTDQPPPDDHNTNDMQQRAPYVVYAIRRTYALAKRRIAVVGHSQGGMIMRWALRFWPDLRPMVEDVVGMAGTNHGSTTVDNMCTPDCAPAIWQQRAISDWTKALNSRAETFAGIDYTEIYSHTDEFVTPNQDDTGSSAVHGPGRITNVALQDLCPADASEHLLIGTTDPVASALVFDAISHRGPANPKRIDATVCQQAAMPGFDPVTGPGDLAAALARVFTGLATAPHVPAEPRLRCYVFLGCRH